MNNPTFEIHLDGLGQYRFRVRGSNNRIVTFGEGCNTLNDCMDGIMDVKETIKEYNDSEINDFTKGETILVFNKPKYGVKIGSTVTFSGRLFGNPNGEGIENAKISIYESNKTITKETPIAQGYTNSLGGFYINWKVRKIDEQNNMLEVYAHFEGKKTLKPSFSKKAKIVLS